MTTDGVLFSSFLGTLATIAFFSATPLVWYFNEEHQGSLKGFLHWVGVHKPPRANLRSVILVLFSSSVVAFGVTVALVLSGHSGRFLGASQEGLSVLTYAILLLFHGLRTGIGEEILFRGLIAKKLILRLGFAKGNILQAVLFGLIHFPTMGGTATTADRVALVFTASLLGYAYGYVMHKKCEGSIVPAIVAHMLHNIAASILLGVIYLCYFR